MRAGLTTKTLSNNSTKQRSINEPIKAYSYTSAPSTSTSAASLSSTWAYTSNTMSVSKLCILVILGAGLHLTMGFTKK